MSSFSGGIRRGRGGSSKRPKLHLDHPTNLHVALKIKRQFCFQRKLKPLFVIDHLNCFTVLFFPLNSNHVRDHLGTACCGSEVLKPSGTFYSKTQTLHWENLLSTFKRIKHWGIMNIEKLYFELKLRCLILAPHSTTSAFSAAFQCLLPEHTWIWIHGHTLNADMRLSVYQKQEVMWQTVRKEISECE